MEHSNYPQDNAFDFEAAMPGPSHEVSTSPNQAKSQSQLEALVTNKSIQDGILPDEPNLPLEERSSSKEPTASSNEHNKSDQTANTVDDWAIELEKAMEAFGKDPATLFDEYTPAITTMVEKVKEAVSVATKSSEHVRSLIYDLDNRVSKVKTYERQAELIIQFTQKDTIQSHQEELIVLLKNCQSLLQKIVVSTATGMSRPPPLIPLRSKGPETSTPRAPRKEQPRKNYDGEYVLLIVPKEPTTNNTVDVFYEAMQRVRIHVKEAKPKGTSAKITFRTLEDLELAESALNSYQKGGEMLNTLYDIQKKITSKYTIVTDKFPKKATRKMPFIADGQVVLRKAKYHLSLRNPNIWHAEEDVIGVELKTVDEGDKSWHKLLLHCSRQAHEDAMTTTNRNGTIDLIATRVHYKDATKEQVCFKCRKPGHVIAQCKQELPNCNFCLGHHPSGKCKVLRDKAPFECHKCRAYNLKQDNPSNRRPEDHAANDACCLTAREERAIAYRNRRTRKQKHGR